ncbi:MFS general substrate transporter [Glarea lozoyensis ATCC 20868]|uniref:MFS general substrate transporter n=1 Tax=Glarea lozoyensis (strain ATCC 20868 / MF5171) TaxID=1116229 RepID=S3CM38_GLAL2|nr:MFS general substrate transporter [Glarea lozoyensis ATCC 20868]EPE26755.1 MFS general substrate transporter [Glarea lozoyensis ATCC 20868]
MSSDASLKKDMMAETPESLSPPLSTTASNELTPEEAARAFKPTVAFYLAMTTLALLTFIVALDATALAVALPNISEEIHGTGLEAFWAGTAFMLCCAVFQPVIGSFSTIFGRKYLLTGAVLFFLAGCIGCALAKNFNTILICRAIQGAGGGGIVVMTEIVVCDMIPLRLRGEWFGLLSGMYAVGTVLGPIIGGAFAQHVTWRWIFWINLPFIGVAIVMVPICINLKVASTSFLAKIKKIDYIGATIFIGSATGFMMGISWGGVQYAWSSWHTIVPIIVGVAGFVAFYFYEDKIAADPVVPTSIFKNRNITAAYIQTVIHSLIVLSLVYYLPLYYEGVKGFNTTITGVAVFPETFTVAPAAVVIGIVIGKVGSFRWAVWSGWLISILGLGILYLMDVHTTTVQWVFLNLVAGIGTGFLYPALQFSIQSACKDEDLASAVSMYSFFRAVGQTLGVAVGGVILQNQLAVKISAYPALAPMAKRYSQDATALAHLLRDMADSQDRRDLVQAYADSLKVVWIVMCGLAGLGFIISLLIKDYPLDRFVPAVQAVEGEKDKVGDEEVPVAVVEKKAETVAI